VELLKQKLKVLEEVQDQQKKMVEAKIRPGLESLLPLQPLLLETMLAILGGAEARQEALRPLEAALKEWEDELPIREASKKYPSAYLGQIRAELLALKIQVARAKGVAKGKGDPKIEEWLRERCDVLVKVREELLQEVKAGKGNTKSELPTIAREWLKAELALTTKPTERLALLEKHLESARWHEQQQKAWYEDQKAPLTQYLEAVADRLDAEIWVLRAKSAVAPAK
jgi:hypothetical protein